MRRPEKFASPTQPDSVDSDELSDLMQELKLLKQRITILEASVFGSPQNQARKVPVGRERELHFAEIADVHDAQITVQRHGQQGANIAIAIRSPSTQQASSVFPSTLFPMPIPTASQPMPTASPSTQQASSVFPSTLFPMPIPTASQPMPTASPLMPTASPPMPIPSQSSVSSWGPMMTPSEVQQLMAPEPESGEYYVVTKGRRPGVYLSWADAHELIDGLKSPCYWKKNNKHAALGQYTIAYQKGNCECRFH